MKMIIDIPDKKEILEKYHIHMDLMYELKHKIGISHEGIEIIEEAIRCGTPLPKGHGRLIDADERRTEIDEEDRWVVDNAPTVIEASESEG